MMDRNKVEANATKLLTEFTAIIIKQEQSYEMVTASIIATSDVLVMLATALARDRAVDVVSASIATAFERRAQHDERNSA